MKDTREVWQRGPLENMPALLQPVAHALLQAREELYDMMENFPEELLWKRPGGVASPAFHLQHLTGVLDRLFTYADEQALTAEQLHFVANESNEADSSNNLSQMLTLFSKQVDKSLQKLAITNVGSLTSGRFVGRQKIPTTLIGLYVHAAEHTMRHIGQLLVTVRVLKNPATLQQ